MRSRAKLAVLAVALLVGLSSVAAVPSSRVSAAPPRFDRIIVSGSVNATLPVQGEVRAYLGFTDDAILVRARVIDGLYVLSYPAGFPVFLAFVPDRPSRLTWWFAPGTSSPSFARSYLFEPSDEPFGNLFSASFFPDRGGAITVTVTDTLGQPVQGATVRATDLGGFDTLIASETDDRGVAELWGMPHGHHLVRVEAPEGSGLVDRWWPSADASTGATPVVLEPPTPDDVSEASVSIVLPGTATLGGRVLGEDGTPLEGAQVTVMSSVGSRSSLTTADGRYVVDSLPPADVRVKFEAPGLWPEFNGGQFAANSANASYEDDALPIVIGPGAVVTGIDAQLERAGSFGGVVTDPDGVPAEGVLVTWRSTYTSPTFTTVSDAEGRYSFTDVPAGEHLPPLFEAPGMVTTFQRTPVVVAPASTTTVDHRLVRAGVLEIEMLDESGGPLDFAFVHVEPVDLSVPYTAIGFIEDGVSIRPGLPPGQYRISLDPADGVHPMEYFDNAVVPSLATLVTVVAGEVTRVTMQVGFDDVLLPEAPIDVVATQAGVDRLSVAFAPSPVDSGAPSLFRATCSSDGAPSATAVMSAEGISSPLVVDGLVPGQQYACAVTASNLRGTGPSSAPSAPVTMASAPGAPSGLVVELVGPGRVSVRFAPPVSDGGSAILFTRVVCSSPGGVARSSTTAGDTVALGGLTPGATYRCAAASTNAAGKGPASARSAEILVIGRPTAPTAVYTGWAGSGRFGVLVLPPLYDGGSAIVSYRVVCTSSDGGRARSAQRATNFVTVTSLTVGATYTCVASASNAVGKSLPSPASSALAAT